MNDLCFLPATCLSNMLEQGKISSVELLDAHLQQINTHNPALNAIVTPTPDLAREQAIASDERRRRGAVVGPLDGLPFATKDKFDMAGVRSTYGSPAFADHVPAGDDLIVARERAAGGVFAGKTNVPEFSFGGQTNNPVFGLTHNPYGHDMSVSGSSGGSAVALASGMAALANGSDIAGSLRAPAAWCNVVGFRPTPGRIPVSRSNNMWEEFSVHGPLARTAADIALYMSAIAGPSSVSPVSWPGSASEFAIPLARSWQDSRLAWSLDMSVNVQRDAPGDAEGDAQGQQYDPAMVKTLETAKAVFAEIGSRIVDACPAVRDASAVLDDYKCLAALSRVGNLVDQQPATVNAVIHRKVERGRAFSADHIIALDKRRSGIWQCMVEFFENHDYLIWPVTPCNPIKGLADDSTMDWAMLDPQPLLGLPAISVPCGFSDDGMPVGIQITGRRGDDMGVIQLAHAFEQETGFWKQRAPGF